MKKINLVVVGLGQALAVGIYCSLVGLIFWRGNEWFGMVPNYWGPLLFLVLFATSALVCAFLALGYPAILVWKEKKPEEAVKLVGYTAGWLVLISLLVMVVVKIS